MPIKHMPEEKRRGELSCCMRQEDLSSYLVIDEENLSCYLAWNIIGFPFYGHTLSDLAGSPAYVAPEVLLGNYSEKVDIWSAGVLLHGLLVGVLPFQGDSLKAVFEVFKNVKLDFHSGIWKSVSKPARDLLARMLMRDVSSRITADEVLRHPWILFYTEHSLKTLSIRSKLKNQGSQPVLTSNSLSCKSEEQYENGVVDVLAMAISHVKISEPKRSRLCSPTGPIKQQCLFNLTANNLCRAF
ncbi:hypothetical protein CRYUN_Cryun30bG0055200 [Craigia yunnanensis]